MELESVIDGYFAAIRTKDIDALTDLYAEDATFILPDGREFSGIDAIRAMHLALFSASAPMPSPGARIMSRSAAAVEIEARLPDGTVRQTTNHYFLDEAGKIARMNVYMKSG